MRIHHLLWDRDLSLHVRRREKYFESFELQIASICETPFTNWKLLFRVFPLPPLPRMTYPGTVSMLAQVAESMVGSTIVDIDDLRSFEWFFFLLSPLFFLPPSPFFFSSIFFFLGFSGTLCVYPTLPHCNHGLVLKCTPIM